MSIVEVPAASGPDADCGDGCQGTEPCTVAPGRWRAISADIDEIMMCFQAKLMEFPGDGAGASKSLPKAGAFALFRNLFAERAFSTVVVPFGTELSLDLFQFVASVVWLQLGAVNLEARAGAVFLAYLLYHTQQDQKHRLPVDVSVAEQLLSVGQECLKRGVLVECPAILRSLAQEQALSLGVRAGYRNLHFDRDGRLGERLPAVPEPEPAKPVERLGLKEKRGRGSTASLLTAQDGEPILDVEDAEEEAGAYAELRSLAGSSPATPLASPGTPLAEGSPAVEALAEGEVSSASRRYVSRTPPPPQEIRLAAGVPDVPREDHSAVPRRRWTKRLRPNQKEDVTPDDGVPRPPLRTSSEADELELAEGRHVTPLKPRTRAAAQSRLLGVKLAIARTTVVPDPASDEICSPDAPAGTEVRSNSTTLAVPGGGLEEPTDAEAADSDGDISMG